MSDKPNDKSIAKLISEVEEFAKEGDPKALELIESIEGFRLQAEMVIKRRELIKKVQEENQKRLKDKNEADRKKELSQWISEMRRGEGVEAKQLTDSDLDLISRHHIGIFETDVVELNKIVIGSDGPKIAKGWIEDFQKLIFPDGGREGSLQVRLDDDGTVADVRIKRK